MMPGRTNLQLQILLIAIRAVGPAVDVVRRYWTICTNRAGVWIFRPTLVCFTVVSDITLSLLAMCGLFLTSDILGVSGVLGVCPRKCKGTREYVRKPPSLPLARKTAGVRECGAT